MALKKKIQDIRGITAEYHMIRNLSLQKNGVADFQVISYANEEFRKKDEDDPMSGRYILSGELYSFPTDGSVSYEDAYNYLKTTEIFKGAEDC